MKLYECDRCKDHVSRIKTISWSGWDNTYVYPFVTVRRELCLQCWNELQSWLNNDLYHLEKFIYDEENKTVNKVFGGKRK